jgi:pyruvate formate lyase activating enzyme
MIKKMCEWLVDNDMEMFPLHFSRFHPQHKLTNLPETPLSTLGKAHSIALDAGIKYCYIGNVPGSQAEHTYCPACKELLIERKGFYIARNNIKDSKCNNCNEKIDGVWE